MKALPRHLKDSIILPDYAKLLINREITKYREFGLILNINPLIILTFMVKIPFYINIFL